MLRANYALAFLLREGVCNINTRPYIVNPWDAEAEREVSAESTIVVFANTNDLFAWGVADAEEIEFDDDVGDEDSVAGLYGLLKLHLADRHWGWARWACIKCDEQPQGPVREAMERAGVWDEVLAALPENVCDKMIEEKSNNAGE